MTSEPAFERQPTNNSSFARHAGITLYWSDIGYDVQVKGPDGATFWKPLVRNVSGAARPGRVLAIMGPSGAGKTTFLNAVSGRMGNSPVATVHGVTFMNNVVLSERYRPLTAFVTQDDICMGKNTPRETIYMSRRLARGAGVEEAQTLTDVMIQRLSLQPCADTLIGIPGLIKGISGGEKKRTNIGCELVNDPDVVFLDEPTTGLDSVNALRVGLLLKDIAENDNRTVLCTIHTPSSELFNLFDDIMLLANGQVVYHGPRATAPAYFAAVGHPLPHRVNPSEFYMELLQRDVETIDKLVAAFAKCVSMQQTVQLTQAALQTHNAASGEAEPVTIVLPHVPPETAPAEPPAAAAAPGWEGPNLSQAEPHFDRIQLTSDAFDAMMGTRGASFATELGTLLKRSWQLTMRDPGGTIGRFVQVVFFALIIGLLFFKIGGGDSGVQDRQGAIFFFVLNAFFANVMPALASFPPERAVFLNEMSKSLYHPVTYYLAKTIAEIPVQVFMNVIMIIIVYWMIGLQGSAEAFFIFFGIAMAYTYCANAFGVFVASLFPKQEVAMAVVPMAILPMMLVGGLFANTARLDPYWIWLDYLSIVRFAFIGMVNNEFNHLPVLCNPSQHCRFNTGAEVISFLGFDKTDSSVSMCVVALCVYMVGLRVIGAVGLWVQGMGKRASLPFVENWKQHPANISGSSSPTASRRNVAIEN